MAATREADFPEGHPARFDYDPDSPEAIEWRRKNVSLKGERDFPVDHPKAADTEGNTNHLQWVGGVDPLHPELEQFTGRNAETVARMAEITKAMSAAAKETPAAEPVIAPKPPQAPAAQAPAGQPGR